MRQKLHVKHKLWNYWWFIATFIKFLKYYHYKQRQKVTWRIAMDAWFTFSMIAIVVTFQSYFVIVQLNCGTTWEMTSLSDLWKQIRTETLQLFYHDDLADDNTNDTVSQNSTNITGINKDLLLLKENQSLTVTVDLAQFNNITQEVYAWQCPAPSIIGVFETYQIKQKLQCINLDFQDTKHATSNKNSKRRYRNRKQALDAYYECVIEQEARFLSSVLFVLSICISMQFIVAATRLSIESYLTNLGKHDRIRYYQMRHEIVQLFESKHIWELRNYETGIISALKTKNYKEIYVPKDIQSIIISFALDDVETFDQDSDLSSRSSIFTNIDNFQIPTHIHQNIQTQTQTQIQRTRIHHQFAIADGSEADDISSAVIGREFDAHGQLNLDQQGMIIDQSQIGLDSSSEVALQNLNDQIQNGNNQLNTNQNNLTNAIVQNNDNIENENENDDDDEIIARLLENESNGNDNLHGSYSERVSVSFSRLLNKIEKNKRKQWFIFLANCLVIAELAFAFALGGLAIAVFSISTDWVFGVANLLTWLVGVVGTALVLMRSQDLH